MRVLVTGGAGFIGSNLVRALIANHEVGVIDDLSTGNVANLHPAAWFRKIDIAGPALAKTVQEFAPEAVVHLAAQSSVPASILNPERDWEVNVEGTRAVAAAARDAGATRMVSASSAAVYGEADELPLTETVQKRPTNPYGASKLAAEEVLASELAGSRVDWASLRFSNVFGPRQDARGEGGVVAIFCSRLAAGETPVIYGSGSQTRDFIFVGDIVNALIMGTTAETMLNDAGAGGPAYNISTGVQTSVNDLARMLRPTADFFGEFEYAPAREGDVEASALDATKARDVFAWDARVPIDIGLAQTYRWFAANPTDSV